MVFVFGLRLWSNLGLPFACPGYAPTGFEPMETYPGHAKGSPKLDHNLKPKTKTIIPEEVPLPSSTAHGPARARSNSLRQTS
jgi:hypothetical protein